MDGLKQRIIGALVLVSLAVIFVPMIFDEPHSERTTTSIQIPEEPPFPEVDTPAEDIPPAPVYEEGNTTGSATATGSESSGNEGSGNESSAPDYRLVEKQDASAPAADANEPSAESSAAPSASAESPADATAQAPDSVEYSGSLKGAWVVQLGSFGNPDNARRLRDNVREKGYNSHLQEVERGDVTLVRVFSGPFASKSEAEAAKQKLDQAFGLKSLVTEGDK
ncbi:sporulation domain-containing protein [Marinobacter santoriniensis NKSG1]|uniref:Sporulation domain-containing protein n=1 Tax=Marinobacter santoriniensis NKSG1 TaxID=1288826 RepID=M7DCV8_9GAMM|nr:SPOR domain-containing protein [Marinobacter santoriniensis]EMP55497.1 sporulation domain-containing protein [Marinobacter santoriniensis NKSG1]